MSKPDALPPASPGSSHKAPAIRGLRGQWQRLHPLSPLVRSGRGAIPIVLILLIPRYGGRGSSSEIEHLAILGVIFVLALVSWLVTRWRVEGGVLRVDSGLIRRTSERLPLSQIQAIDIVRPGLARLFGLSELRIRLAGGARKAGRLAYLASDEAERLRSRLLSMSHGTDGAAPTSAVQMLLAVPPARLLAAQALTGLGLCLELVIGALVVLAIVAPATAAAAISAGAFAILALLLAMFRRINAGYRFTVSEAPDGLRLRCGLIETTAETIPRGRIQAIRMSEPLAWRILGWCRLEVDVAGQKPKGRQDRDASRAVRALLPVGDRQQAHALVGRVFPELPHERHPPPRRARFKTPLRFRYLSWGANERYAVTTSGRVRRLTDWVPLAKVQSIRQVQGPAQRSLRLASLHLDTAGRNVHAVLRDRDRAEIADLLQVLPERCRRARQREGAGAGERSR